ncbi:MAG: dihydropteroate synthase [Clostridiales bacterium]|nr:dihydropteroate synthase [Clostridiales bacterium]MDK2933631.1 dihydropteroate synthase [Clostridiales bacterium]
MEKAKIVHINTIKEAAKELKKIGVDEGGLPFLIPKAVHLAIKLEKIKPVPANILKQEMLAQGGDAAVNRGVITHSVAFTDVLLLGTVKQYRQLIKKLRLQPFGLKEVAVQIEEILNTL